MFWTIPSKTEAKRIFRRTTGAFRPQPAESAFGRGPPVLSPPLVPLWFFGFNSIQFRFICVVPFYNRCFTESETQSQNPQVSTVAR